MEELKEINSQLDLLEIDKEKINDIKAKLIDSIYENKEINDFINMNHLAKDFVYENLNAFNNALICKNNCKNCPGLNKCQNKGFIYDIKIEDNKVTNSLIQCDKLKQKAACKKNFALNTMDDKIYDYSMADLLLTFKKERALVVTDMAKMIKGNHFDKGIYLYGDPGIGKSFIMQVFAKTVSLKINKLCAHIEPFYEFDYLNNRAPWNKQEYIEEMDLLTSIPFLFIDGLGQEGEEGKFLNSNLVLELLKQRAKNNLPTFITSRYSPKDLYEVYKLSVNGKRNVMEINQIINENFNVYQLISMKYPF